MGKVMVSSYFSVTKQKHLAGVLAVAVTAVGLTVPHSSSRAATTFTPPGIFKLPQEIVPAPGGGYLVSDAGKDSIDLVPAAGGPPTSEQAMCFSASNCFGPFG